MALRQRRNLGFYSQKDSASEKEMPYLYDEAHLLPKPSLYHMSNKEILQKANTYITQGDYEGFLQYCTDDTLWIFVGDETLKGKKAVREYMAKAYAEPPQFEVQHLIAEGDFVTAVGQISMKGKDGNLIRYSYCDVWRFRDGNMAELNAFVIKAEENS